MSLDVYLNLKGYENAPQFEAIFIRESGMQKQITRAEWDMRYPDREPQTVTVASSDEVYSANITHNLGPMAKEAGLYDCVWRPDENGITKASQLIVPLRAGIDALKRDTERFKVFNPKNGWGTFEGLVAFAEAYLSACEQFPEAEVRVSR